MLHHQASIDLDEVRTILLLLLLLLRLLGRSPCCCSCCRPGCPLLFVAPTNESFLLQLYKFAEEWDVCPMHVNKPALAQIFREANRGDEDGT